METVDDFADTGAPENGPPVSPFVVDVDGFEGPIDVLLTLAREQKVDLTQISILQLADQYLAFVAQAQRTSLELAADYLVMAAWLAYIKSRLLLPDTGAEDEPTGEEMAAALAFQLRRLEAMQDGGRRIMALPRLGTDIFARGAPEVFPVSTSTVVEATLFELLKGYGAQTRRRGTTTLAIEAWDLFTVEDAIQYLTRMLGDMPDWESLWNFLPADASGGLVARSALASTFAASLELTREGRLKMRQNGTYGPIYVRAADAREGRVPRPVGGSGSP